MQTRIKVEQLVNGTKRYYPQAKVFLFWKNMTQVVYYDGYREVVSKHTLEDAMKYIDSVLKAEQDYLGQEGATTTYVKYP